MKLTRFLSLSQYLTVSLSLSPSLPLSPCHLILDNLIYYIQCCCCALVELFLLLNSFVIIWMKEKKHYDNRVSNSVLIWWSSLIHLSPEESVSAEDYFPIIRISENPFYAESKSNFICLLDKRKILIYERQNYITICMLKLQPIVVISRSLGLPRLPRGLTKSS